MGTCHYCRSEVDNAAIVCPHCRNELSYGGLPRFRPSSSSGGPLYTFISWVLIITMIVWVVGIQLGYWKA